MDFQEKYQALEKKFREQVEEDLECHGTQSEFLPNLAPKGKVDFVLVAMEPSGGKSQEEVAKNPLLSPKNFSGSVEDFILHYCLQNYLCGDGRDCYLTDLSKGSMPINEAAVDRYRRYKRWYPLLEEEIELVAKSGTPIIPIGNYVHGFLAERRKTDLHANILHYSQSAGGARKKIPSLYPDEYHDFRETVSWCEIEDTVRRVLEKNDMPERIKPRIEKFRRGAKLTESRKKLIFTYKVQFARIRMATGVD